MAIELEVLADSKRAREDLAKLKDSVNAIQSSTEKLSNSFGKIAQVIGASIAAFASFKVFTDMSDDATRLDTRIRMITKSQKEFNYAYSQIARISIETRSGLSETSKLYTKVAMSSKDLGINLRQVSLFSELSSKAIASSGASAQEASAGLLQLGQALGAGTLAGDELKSIMENTPGLAREIAAGLNISYGNMKKLGAEGKLTSREVFDAILKRQSQINENFAKVGVTYAQAFGNLGNSFTLLFNAASRAFSGSSSSLAVGINKIAIRLAGIANNFGKSMLDARGFVVIFVDDALIMFDELSTVFQNLAIDIRDGAIALYEEWSPAIQKVSAELMDWAKSSLVAISALIAGIINSFKASKLGSELITYFKGIGKFIGDIFSKLDIHFPTIDVYKIFPNLDKALAYVKNWAKQIEQWFFWIYDRVIGHSWIPDLVEGVGSWLARLMGGPLSSVLTFAKKVSDIFGKLRAVSVLGAGFGLLTLSKYSTVLKSILLATAAIGTIAWAKQKSDSNNKPSAVKVAPVETKSFFAEFIDILKNSYKTAMDWIASKYEKTKKAFGETGFAHFSKQLLGMRDTVAGSLFGRNIDTKAYVGLGPERKSAIRTPGHDIINSLPVKLQVPAITGITAAIGLAIVGATESGMVRTALLSVLTTVWALVIARTVDSSEIKRLVAFFAEGFTSAIAKVFDAVLGGNAIKDPFGLLSLVAKTMLLFKAGREYLLKGAVGIATAPTKLITASSDRFARASNEKQMAAMSTQLSTLPSRLTATFNKTQTAYNSSIATLASLKDSTGNLIGQTGALAAINSGTVRQFGTAASTLSLLNARVSNSSMSVARNNLGNLGNTSSELANAITERKELSKKLSENIAIQTAAAKQAIKNTSAGATGIVGGVAGYQLGAQIAAGMTGASDWVKTGVTLATSFVGQGVGAALGYSVSSAIIGAFAKVAGLFSLALATTAGLIAVGIALALGSAYVVWSGLGEKWAESFSGMARKFFADSPEQAAKSDHYNNMIQGSSTHLRDLASKRIDLFHNKDKIDPKAYADAIKKIDIESDRLKEQIRIYGESLTKLSEKASYLAKTFGGIAPSEDSQFAINDLANEDSMSDFFRNLSFKFDNLLSRFGGRKYATGGFISGPGTGTSDSIPAMLSNGEFVINAKSSKENAGILHAINNGKKVGYFADGKTKDKSFRDTFKDNTTEEYLNRLVLSPSTYKRLYGNISSNIASTNMLPYFANFVGQIRPSFSEYIGKNRSTNFSFYAGLPSDLFGKGGKNPILELASMNYRSGKAAVEAYAVNLHEIGHARSSAARFNSEYANHTEPFAKILEGIPLIGKLVSKRNKINAYNRLAIRDTRDRENLLSGVLVEEFAASDFALSNSGFKKGSEEDYIVSHQLTKALRSYFYSVLNDKTGIYSTNSIKDNVEANWSEIAAVLNNKRMMDLLDDAVINQSAQKALKLKTLISSNMPELSAAKEASSTIPYSKAGFSAMYPGLGLGYATGGFISGPGTGTSDSIPAMLSNGEFVINAKSSKENASLLQYINDGGKTRKFVRGYTGDSATLSLPSTLQPTSVVEVSNMGSFSDSLKSFIKDPMKSIGEISPSFDKFIKSFSASSSKSNGSLEKIQTSLIDQLAAQRTSGSAQNLILSALKSAGATGVTAQDVQNASPEMLKSIADTLDSIKNFEERAIKAKGRPFGVRINTEQANLYRASLQDQLQSADFANSSVTGAVAGKSLPVKLQSAYELVNKVFPELNLKISEYLSATNEVQNAMYRQAFALDSRTNKILNLVVGDEKGGPSRKLPKLDVSKEQKAIQAETELAMVSMRSLLYPIRTSFDDASISFSRAGVEVSREIYDQLTMSQRDLLNTYVTGIIENLDIMRKDLSIDRAPLTAENVRLRENANAQLADISDKSSFPSFNLQMKRYGIASDIQRSEFNRMGQGDLLEADRLGKSIYQNSQLTKTGDTAEIRLAAQQVLDNTVDELNEFLLRFSKGYKSEQKLAGEAFAQSIADNISGNIKDVFNGVKADDTKSYFVNFRDSFLKNAAKTIIDTTLNGFLSSFLGSKGSITKLIESFGESLFGSGKVVGDVTKTTTAKIEKALPNFPELSTGGPTFKQKDVPIDYGKNYDLSTETSITSPEKLRIEDFQTVEMKDNLDLIIDQFKKFRLELENVTDLSSPDSPLKLKTSKSLGDLPTNSNLKPIADNATLSLKSSSTLGNSLAPGETAGIKDTSKLTKGFFDDFGSSLANGFQQLKSGNLSGALNSFFGGFGNLLSSGLKALSNLFSGGSGGGGGLGSLFGGLGSLFGSSFGGPGGLAGLAPMGSALEFFLFADGGKVNGPGSGTSDSIPAMLSNGEFVMNARATKDNLRLLSAINSGKMPKFAAGGLVGAAMLATPAMAEIAPSNSKTSTQQVFNINVTGDISQQTRSEIQRMIPNIATGVNMHNAEKGRR